MGAAALAVAVWATAAAAQMGWHRPGGLGADAGKLRDLFQLVGNSDSTEVLIDDRPVPFARELWLPLVWLLVPRDRH